LRRQDNANAAGEQDEETCGADPDARPAATRRLLLRLPGPLRGGSPWRLHVSPSDARYLMSPAVPRTVHAQTFCTPG